MPTASQPRSLDFQAGSRFCNYILLTISVFFLEQDSLAGLRLESLIYI